MALIVQKFGGAVLSDVAKIRKVARYIAGLAAQGHRIVAVVSAMGDTTDDLTRLANAVARRPDKREMDMLLSVGERITMSLLAMAIEDTGKAKAVSYTGSQVGIITDTQHTDARIVAVQSERLKQALDEGKVVVVAGFQGVSLEREITTLGRGGSDTTAIALAAALSADRCDLIKEVPGIFSSDPELVPGSSPIPEMDFAGVRGLSLGGARVLKESCVDLAEYYGIEIRVGTLQKQTIVRREACAPYFSVTMKEGYRLYRNLGYEDLKRFPTGTETLAAGDGLHIYLPDEAGKVSIKRKSMEVVSDVIKLTAVGDSADRALQHIEAERGVDELYGYYASRRECRIYFSSKDAPAILRRIHDAMKETVIDKS